MDIFAHQGQILPGVRAAFTDRTAGNLAHHVGPDPDAVQQHRSGVARRAGVAAFAYMTQVHGTTVTRVEGAEILASEQAPVADGLFSTQQPLAVMVADCVPVLLAGQTASGGTIHAAVHAGRPGLAAGIIPHAVAQLRAAGASGLLAWLGPSVCGRCYEVPAALQAEVAAIIPETLASTSWGTPALDLPAGVAAQLEREGVRVDYRGPCTMEDEKFFSHRREPGAGRIAGLIWKEETA